MFLEFAKQQEDEDQSGGTDPSNRKTASTMRKISVKESAASVPASAKDDAPKSTKLWWRDIHYSLAQKLIINSRWPKINYDVTMGQFHSLSLD